MARVVKFFLVKILSKVDDENLETPKLVMIGFGDEAVFQSKLDVTLRHSR
jgi:hypothetical protein